MKLLVYRKGNRRVPNGTHGGVRGRRETASYSMFVFSFACKQLAINDNRYAVAWMFSMMNSSCNAYEL